MSQLLTNIFYDDSNLVKSSVYKTGPREFLLKFYSKEGYEVEERVLTGVNEGYAEAIAEDWKDTRTLLKG